MTESIMMTYKLFVVDSWLHQSTSNLTSIHHLLAVSSFVVQHVEASRCYLSFCARCHHQFAFCALPIYLDATTMTLILLLPSTGNVHLWLLFREKRRRIFVPLASWIAMPFRQFELPLASWLLVCLFVSAYSTTV